MSGLEELRVKESDRLGAMANGLAACGVRVEVVGDDLLVPGGDNGVAGGATIAVDLDHRIAMSFLVLGMVSEDGLAIDDAAAIDMRRAARRRRVCQNVAQTGGDRTTKKN